MTPQAQGPEGKNLDVVASLVLLAATVLALLAANSGFAGAYKAFLALPVKIGIGEALFDEPLKVFIKNALMAVFFLAVGLEIKAEFTHGALAERRRAVLPFLAAAGGMAGPALVYLAIAGGDPVFARGWAIPSATDIAFAIGIVGLLGRRVPAALKAFLLAVAVIDDLGAILIIAAMFTERFDFAALAAAFAIVSAMGMLNARGEARHWPYLALGLALWIAVGASGVNPTLAGVVTALFVPLSGPNGSHPLHALETVLKVPVLFVIMPIFAFANAGVALYGLQLGDLGHPVTAGVALGLFIAKPVGICGAVLLAEGLRLGQRPVGVTFRQLAGVGCLAGIGFTMSLFIGALAFGDGALLDKVRIGVLAGSLLSTAAGVALLLAVRKSERGGAEPQPALDTKAV